MAPFAHITKVLSVLGGEIPPKLAEKQFKRMTFVGNCVEEVFLQKLFGGLEFHGFVNLLDTGI